MSTLQELREKRANIWSQMTEVMEAAEKEGRSLSGEERQKYDRAESELDTIGEEIDLQERHAKHAADIAKVDRSELRAPGKPVDAPQRKADERYIDAFRSWMANGLEGMDDPEQKQILRGQFDKLGDSERAELRAAGVGSGSAGGYLVPPLFRDKVVQTMKYYGPMLDVAERINTTSGADLPWPTSDDTANVGAILAENTQASEQDVTLGTATLSAYMYISKVVRASFQILNDREDFDGWLAARLGERIGRILNQHFTTGTGSSQPQGIVTGASTGVTGSGSFATTGGISYGNLVDLVESLDPAYGNGAGLAFMGHQSVRKALRKLTDSQNRPLWEPSVQQGTPDTLLGYPYLVNNDMATLAASSKSLLFGNYREAYVIRTVEGISLLRFNERWGDFLQVGFLSYQRAGGAVQNANAVRAFVTTSTA